MKVVFSMCLLFIPLFILCLGYGWRHKGPNEINSGWGYRTKRSMASQDAWNFAHKYFAKIIRFIGTPMCIITILFIPIYVKYEEEKMCNILIFTMFLQLAFVILAVIRTEYVLNKNFYKNGRYKQ